MFGARAGAGQAEQAGEGSSSSLWVGLPGTGICQGTALHSLLFPHPICGQIPVYDFASVAPFLLMESGFAFPPEPPCSGSPRGSSQSWVLFAGHPQDLGRSLGREGHWNSCSASPSPGWRGWRPPLPAEITRGQERSQKPEQEPWAACPCPGEQQEPLLALGM